MASINFVLTVDRLAANLPSRFQPESSAVFHLDGDWSTRLARDKGLPPLMAVKMDLTDMAYVTMTSGSTGKPKGVVNAHISAVCDFMARVEALPYSAGDREAFNVFFIWEALRPLLAGYAAYCIPDEVILDPKKLAKYIEVRDCLWIECSSVCSLVSIYVLQERCAPE